MKQYTSFLFPTPKFIGLLMDLNFTKKGVCHLSEFMTRRGIDYTAAIGHTFPPPMPTRQAFLDTWKDMAEPLELRPPRDCAHCGQWLQSAFAIMGLQSCPPLMDTIDWGRPSP